MATNIARPSLSSATLPALDDALLDQLTSAVVRRLTVEQIGIAAGKSDALHIGRVEIGEASIAGLTLEDLTARVRCGAALLKNVRAILEMHFDVRWSYDLKWFGADSGTKALGSKAKTIPLHDIRIPMLQDIVIDVPEATISDIGVNVPDITDIALGGSAFADVSVDDTRLPSAGFCVTGMDFESLEIESFGVPAADSRRLRLGRFAPNEPVALPDIQINGLEIPAVDIPDATSDGPVSVMDIDIEDFEAPAFKIGDLFKVIFVVRPILHLQIGELVLSELQASAAVGQASVQGVRAPVAVHDVELGGLRLDAVTAANVRV